MATRLPLTSRQELLADSSANPYVALVTFTGSTLGAPLRFASDGPALQIVDDQPIYGVTSRSNWYHFALAEAVVPGDQAGEPPSLAIAFRHLPRDVIASVRALPRDNPMKCDLELVRYRSPDVVEAAWRKFDVMRAPYGQGEVLFQLSRELTITEECPYGRMTRSEFPGLHP